LIAVCECKDETSGENIQDESLITSTESAEDSSSVENESTEDTSSESESIENIFPIDNGSTEDSSSVDNESTESISSEPESIENSSQIDNGSTEDSSSVDSESAEDNALINNQSEYELESDFRCGTDPDNAKNTCGTICEFITDCPSGQSCFGTWNRCYVNDDSEKAPPTTPLPTQLQAKSDSRCGVTEADARSNCKPECTVNTDCNAGEFCWITHTSYCHIMPENHPQCDHEEAENSILRCGYDEMAARGFCGEPCNTEADCLVPGEKCFPALLNLCQCFEEQDVLAQVIPESRSLLGKQHHRRDLNEIETNREYFDRAKESLDEYFQTDDSNAGVLSKSSAKENQIVWFGLISSTLLFVIPLIM